MLFGAQVRITLRSPQWYTGAVVTSNSEFGEDEKRDLHLILGPKLGSLCVVLGGTGAKYHWALSTKSRPLLASRVVLTGPIYNH